MDKENFIKEALYKPNDYIAYHIGRELAELYPGKVILEARTGYFDLEGFVCSGQCFVVHETSLFNHLKTEWDAPARQLRESIANSWLNVMWRDQLLDVVVVTFTEGCYAWRHQWIVADSKETAESFFKEVCEWSSEVRSEVLVFQDGDWTKDEELFKAIKSSTFDNLILPEALKQEIQVDFAQFFHSREVYERHGIPWKRGVLFIGPPGDGKTHTLKALVNQLGQPCLYVKSFKSEYATDHENMRSVFARARITTPCLLVLEDLDSMIDDNSRAFFLNELDGFENNVGMVVLATTNHPDRLDEAILHRPSRFDRKYYFKAPAASERRAYITNWSRRLRDELSISEQGVSRLVRQTEGFSFAYLKELFLSSMMQWMSYRGMSMDEVIFTQATQLRRQITTTAPVVAQPRKRRSFANLMKRGQ